MAFIDSERFKTLIETPTDLSDNNKIREYFTAHALKHLLGGDYDTVVQSAIDAIPQSVTASPQISLFGFPLGTFMGMSRQQIKTRFNFSDSQVDTIFANAGITE